MFDLTVHFNIGLTGEILFENGNFVNPCCRIKHVRINRVQPVCVSFQAHAMADVLYKIDASSSEETMRSQVNMRRHQI